MKSKKLILQGVEAFLKGRNSSDMHRDGTPRRQQGAGEKTLGMTGKKLLGKNPGCSWQSRDYRVWASWWLVSWYEIEMKIEKISARRHAGVVLPRFGLNMF